MGKKGPLKRKLRTKYSIKVVNNESYSHIVNLGQEIIAFLTSKENWNFKYKKFCYSSYVMDEATYEGVETNITAGI